MGTPILTYHLDTGAVLGGQLRTPYGQPRYSNNASANGGMHTTLGFTGQREDSGGVGAGVGASGLDYFQSRSYDPAVGRFTSADTVSGADPLGDAYAYVGGRVESATDPSGHMLDEGEEGGAEGDAEGDAADALAYANASAGDVLDGQPQSVTTPGNIEMGPDAFTYTDENGDRITFDGTEEIIQKPNGDYTVEPDTLQVPDLVHADELTKQDLLKMRAQGEDTPQTPTTTPTETPTSPPRSRPSPPPPRSRRSRRGSRPPRRGRQYRPHRRVHRLRR